MIVRDIARAILYMNKLMADGYSYLDARLNATIKFNVGLYESTIDVYYNRH